MKQYILDKKCNGEKIENNALNAQKRLIYSSRDSTLVVFLIIYAIDPLILITNYVHFEYDVDRRRNWR